MRVTFDREADAAYVYFSEQVAGSAVVAETRELDDARALDYAADGTLLGVEFLYVSDGVSLSGVPDTEHIAAELHRLGISVTEESSAR